MRISTIKLTQKSNLGNYESMEFTAEADLKEDENVKTATDRLFDYVDWYVKRKTRNDQLQAIKLTLADPATPDDKRAAAERWIEKYEERKNLMEAV